MLSVRTSLTGYEEGFGSLFKNAGSEGIHPPLIELLNFAGFGLFGKDPRSVHLISIVLFVLFAGSVERFLAPYLPSARQRVLAAFTLTICPALALVLFNLWREGLMTIIVVIALALALRPSGIGAKPLALGLVLALLPLTKENGIVFVAPFALYALLIDAADRRTRIIRVAYVAGLPVASELLWRLLREINNATPWSTWVLSDHAERRLLRRRAARHVRLREQRVPAPEPGQRVHRQLAVGPGAARDRHACADLPPSVAGVRAPGGGADRGLLRDLHVDDAGVPDLHRAALRGAADHADGAAGVRRPAAVAAKGAAGRARRAAVRVRRGRVGANGPGLAQAVRDGVRRRRADLQHQRAPSRPGPHGHQLLAAERDPARQRRACAGSTRPARRWSRATATR